MVVLAPGGPPMSRRVYLSHLDMPKGDFRFWPLSGHRRRVFGRPLLGMKQACCSITIDLRTPCPLLR
jgi:hypothetical protein